MTSDPAGSGGTRGFASLTTFQILQMLLGLGTRLWESVAQTFSPQTIILQSLPSLSPFMVSSCLQDKVQTSWQDTWVFYALTLSCFSPDPLFRIPLFTPLLFTAGCWPVCTFAFCEGQEEDGRRERRHHLFSMGSLLLVFHNAVIPKVHTDWALPCSYSTYWVLALY